MPNPATSASDMGVEHGLIVAARRAADAISAAMEDTHTPSCNIPGYEILREIHRGGQGVVYQAIQKTTGQSVAIKVMREGPFAGPQDRARFEREVQILGQLNHPNIVTIHDSGTADGHFFHVMNYIAGEPLDAYVASRRPSVKDTISLFIKICDAVNAAHLMGVIHRDCKPSNVRIDANGNPHILDFGLAKMTAEGGADDAHANAMTLTGQFIGSLPWASPEQALGDQARIDIRTDVYSLGVMLYQMLTGKFPYAVTGNARDVLDNIIHADPIRPGAIRPQINDEVETIVLKCLSKERDRRYQTAGELSRDLQHYLEGRPIEAKRDSSWYVLRKTMRRHRTATGVTLTFLLLITASAITLLFMYRSVVTARDQSQAVTKFLSGMLASPRPTIARGNEVTVRDVLDKASNTVAKDFADKPLVEAMIRGTIGQTYMGLGLNDEAESHLRVAYDIYALKLGEENASTSKSRAELSQLLWLQGKYTEAETLVGSAVDARRLLGPKPIETMHTMHRQSAMYFARNDYAASEKLRRESLAISRRILGDRDRFTLVCMNNLGSVLYEQGNYIEAEALLRQALEIQHQELGEKHPATIHTMANLALVCGEEGMAAEAETLFRKALELSRDVNGIEHPNTLKLTYLLASFLGVHGKLDEARTYTAALIAREKESGEPLRADPASQQGFAWLLLTCEPDDLRDPEAALPRARKAVETSGGPVPHFLYTLALACHATGRIDEAIETQKQALAALPEDETAYRTELELTLASFLQEKGDLQTANTLIEKVVNRQGISQGPKRVELVHRVVELALMVRALGKHQLCGSVCRALFNDVRMGGVHEGESGIATALVALGSVLIQQGKTEDADAILSKWLEIQELGPDHGMKTRDGDSHDGINAFIEQIAELYEFQERANPGKGHTERAAQWRERSEEVEKSE